jgi:holo-[acyl-carrier protein] synthase
LPSTGDREPAIVTVVGVGTDLVDLDRLRTVLARTPSIIDRLFTEDEQRYATRRRDPTERYGGRFAAKEAVLKALGLGLGGAAFREIEVVRAASGAPSVVLHGHAARAASRRGVGAWLVSISHTGRVASAIAVALPVGSTPSSGSTSVAAPT